MLDGTSRRYKVSLCLPLKPILQTCPPSGGYKTHWLGNLIFEFKRGRIVSRRYKALLCFPLASLLKIIPISLVSELKEHLNLFEYVYDDEDKEWYPEFKKELKNIHNYEYGLAKTKSIPVIEEMILYWSSGWSSFGKKFPRENDSTLQPIVKTFIPKDEEDSNSQKQFNSF